MHETLLDVVRRGEGVDVRDLAPASSLFVWTLNTRYRLIITQSQDVFVQGGAFFPEPTAARLIGSSLHPGGWLKVGWVGIDLRLELRAGSRYVVTSPVRAIAGADCIRASHR